MKRIILISLILFSVTKGFSQDYLITFEGTGESTSLDSVLVENLTQDTRITVPGGNQLRLLENITRINKSYFNSEDGLYIYPNPSTIFSQFIFYQRFSGNVTVEVFDISGKIIAKQQFFLETGNQSFTIIGLSKGIYAARIITKNNNYVGKIISKSISYRNVKVNYNGVVTDHNLNSFGKLKSSQAETSMQYTEGDRLKLTGISKNFSTVITDIPSENKNLIFDFFPCTDGDGNNYSAVKIGDQTWMAENMRTTRCRYGNPIPRITDRIAWNSMNSAAYCWYLNDSSEYSNPYGPLYNWYTINTVSLCPSGWHVPADTDWTTMENYLIANGYNYDGTITGNKIAKSLASTNNWKTSDSMGVPANSDYPAYRNRTGFTALPGGHRLWDGTFLDFGYGAYWWSATEDGSSFARFRALYYDNSGVVGYSTISDKRNGYSVRCVRD